MNIICLIILDLLGLFVSYQTAYFIRVKALPFVYVFPEPLPLMLINPVWLPILFVFFFWFEQLYTKKYPIWEEIRQLWKAVFLASLAGFAIVSIGKLSDTVSRTILVLTMLNMLLIAPLIRYFGKKLMLTGKIGNKKLLIIGAGLSGELVLRSLRNERNMGYEVVGFIDDDASKIGKEVAGVRVLGSIADIEKLLVDGIGVIVAIPGMDSGKMVKLVNELQKKVKNIAVVPDLFGIPFLQSDMDFFFDNQLLMLNVRNNLKDPLNIFYKKAFDIFAGIIVLLLLSPVLLILSFIVAFTSKGKIFYSHERIGRKGKTFKCYKFRSMYFDSDERLKEMLLKDPATKAEWEKSFKLKNDPRITPVGAFLRKTSLDELPQIFNVLKGEMSLVGPRPVLKKELEEFYGEYSEYYYEVRPGVTGLWQVSGRSGVDYKKRVSLDVWYVSNWSLWLDVTILIKTIGAVLKQKGAY